MQFFDDVRVGIEQDKRSGALNVYLDQGPFSKRVTLGSKKDSPAAKELSSVLMQRELKALADWHNIKLGGQPNRISARYAVNTGFAQVDIYLDPFYTGQHDSVAGVIDICIYQPWFKMYRSSLSEPVQLEVAAYLRSHLSQLSDYRFVPYTDPAARDEEPQGTEGVVSMTSTPLSQIIGEFATLNGHDGQFSGPCPLHDGSNNRALVVNDQLGTFHCFNCQVKGNAMDFLMAMAKKARPA